MRTRIAVLASGSGTNLQALLDHFDRLGDRRGGDVVVVGSDRAGAGALDRARERDIPTALLHSASRPDQPDVATMLREHRADLVVLAGYLRLVPSGVVASHRDRIVNVHPALLPAFGGPGMYGAHVHAAVLAAGARVTGVTVHTVDEEFDRGRILAQWPVAVRDGDTAASLAERVLRVEHALFPRIVNALAAGSAPRFEPPPDALFVLDDADPTALSRSIDRALRA